MSSVVVRHKLGKRLGGMALGTVVGFGSVMLFMTLGKSHLPMSNPAAMLTFTAGLIILLMGAFVGFGAASPRAGAHFLNVEDAEELKEQRVVLAYASASCVLAGLFLFILAFSASGAEQVLLPANVAAGLACLSLVLAFWTGVKSNAGSDELMRQVGREASALALHVSVLLFGGWAALAHFGFAPLIAPLVLISGFFLIELVAIFWISGRKGMLKPR